MKATNSKIHPHPLTIALVLVLVVLAVVLTSCGGSSSSSSAPKTATGAVAKGSPPKSNALRECLEKQGVKIPAPGSTAAVSPKFREAFEKCGAKLTKRGFSNNSAARQASLKKFAACMRENGIALPEPNTSGTGPIFNEKGIDTTGAAFKAAAKKCLPEAIIASPGAGPGKVKPPPPAGVAASEGG